LPAKAWRKIAWRGLRIPDLRKGDDSPLSTSFHRDVPGACHSQRLQTQRLHRCGPSGTFQTRLQPCADGSFSPSSKTCRDVRAAPLRSGTWRCIKLYDAVRLDGQTQHCPRTFSCWPLIVRLRPRAARLTARGMAQDAIWGGPLGTERGTVPAKHKREFVERNQKHLAWLNA
jgi:hypothetical protein